MKKNNILKTEVLIGKSNDGDLIMHTFNDARDATSCAEIYDDFLNLGLHRGESARITFDNTNRVYYVEKTVREVGWYLTVSTNDHKVVARKWDGGDWYEWYMYRGESHQYPDRNIIAVSGKLPENKYLEGLEK